MKKITLILVFIFSILQGFSYTWESYGPEGIKANNLCLFTSYNAQSIICTDSGMYLNSSQGVPNWEYFDIPAADGILLNEEKLLLLIAEGSYSDGIYDFDLLTHESNVIEFCPKPNFIRYYEIGGIFYVGTENGLLKSEDGLNWEEIPFFAGKNCVDIAFYSSHLIVSVSGDILQLYISGDAGAGWEEASTSLGAISDMVFYNSEEVYAVLPDETYSSGLWHSNDYGDNWENTFYSMEMSVICNVGFSDRLLLGWKSDIYDDEGIAVYDPGVPGAGLVFLNDGLPNKQINKIRYMELLCSGGVIFACTDNGVYQCWDYFVGIDEHSSKIGSIDVFPNPITKQTTIKLNHLQNNDNDNIIRIYNSKGLKVDEIRIGTNPETIWDKGGLPSGVYYMAIKTKNRNISKKIIIL